MLGLDSSTYPSISDGDKRSVWPIYWNMTRFLALSIFNFRTRLFIYSFFGLCLFFLLPVLTLSAQDIIEPESEKTDQELSSSSYWDQHFRARIGSSYAHGLDGRSYRVYSYSSLAWKDQFGDFYFNIEGLAFRRDYKYSLELNPDDNKDLVQDIQALDNRINMITSGKVRNANDVCSSILSGPNAQVSRLKGLCKRYEERQRRLKFNLVLQDNAFIFPEANVKYAAGDLAEILLGYHTIVWGQLDFLSPVDFILPFRLGSTGLGITKADNRNPQLMALLSLFPQPWFEVQAYFFPELGIDNAFLDNIQQESGQNNSEYREIKQLDIPKGKDAYRYALRTLFYLDDITFGFIYYRGYFQFDAQDNLTLSQSTEAGKPVYRMQGNPELNAIQTIGFESAYPVGKWVWKLDAIHFSIAEDLEFDVEKYNDQLLGYLPRDEFFNKRTDYVNWVLNENNGKFQITNSLSIATLGVDAELDRWVLNLGVLFFLVERSDKDEKGNELYTKAEDVEDQFFNSNFFAAPIINTAYYFNDKKKDGIGIAMGFLNSGVGIILYTAKEFYESLYVAVAFEYLIIFSNGLVDVEGYQLEDPAYPALRFIVDYRL